MQDSNTRKLVSERPYRFMPASRSRWWPKILAPILLPFMRKYWARIRRMEYHGHEHLQESLEQGHGIILSPNHCRPVDPLVLLTMVWKHGYSMYGMTSSHLFENHWSVRVLARRLGAFSILREGSDRESLDFAMQAVINAERPVVILPEGGLSRTNDRLRPLLDGLAFVARSAARRRAKTDPPGRVVIHPMAIKYHMVGDLDSAIVPALQTLERELHVDDGSTCTLLERTERIVDAVASRQESKRGLKHPDMGLTDRLEALCRYVLEPLEIEWLKEAPASDDFVIRVKNLRALMLPAVRNPDTTATDRDQLWRVLQELDLVHQWSLLFPRDYLLADSPPEHFVETMERLEEYFTGQITMRGQWDVVTSIGAAIEVPSNRERHADRDPLMVKLQSEMKLLLDGLIQSQT